MTDEEKAEEYTNEKHCKKCINFAECVESAIEDRCKTYRESYNDYLNGLTESKPKWHDLRKNPDDLPKDDRQCLCFISTCYFVGYYDKEYDQEWHFDEFCTNKIDAWCELPEFEG